MRCRVLSDSMALAKQNPSVAPNSLGHIFTSPLDVILPDKLKKHQARPSKSPFPTVLFGYSGSFANRAHHRLNFKLSHEMFRPKA